MKGRYQVVIGCTHPHPGIQCHCPHNRPHTDRRRNRGPSGTSRVDGRHDLRSGSCFHSHTCPDHTPDPRHRNRCTNQEYCHKTCSYYRSWLIDIHLHLHNQTHPPGTRPGTGRGRTPLCCGTKPLHCSCVVGSSSVRTRSHRGSQSQCHLCQVGRYSCKIQAC